MNDEVQDELDYQELIAKVALINKDAADYMHGPMRKLEGFSACCDLWSVIVWEDTPQGTDFWYDIACKLGIDNDE